MSLQDWNPHEAGAALQKWKMKLRKAFGAIGINEGKQPVSRMATLEEDPSKMSLPPTPKMLECTLPTERGADRDAFSTADASPYLQDSHTVTPRSTSRMRRMDAEDDGSRSRRGGARASKNGSGRRQTHIDASSSDDDDLLTPAYEDEDPQAELTRQMREIAALNDSDPTPRIEMASHRPLDRIKPFSGSRNKSESSMHWLRTFVYEMTGTHTEADKWCIPFELSLRDGAIHWFRQLPKKTKRTWKLLGNVFIRYYCSQFTQTALSRYYSAKRERSEHLCDYLNRLNGYARNTRLQLVRPSSSDGSLVDNDRHLAAANEGERRAAADGTYARSDSRQPRGNIPDRERTFNQDRRGGERSFNQDRRGGDRSFGQDSRGRRDFARDNRRPQYGPCAVCGGMSRSAQYCNKRCMFCKQAHDAGQCELFRNSQDLAKFVREGGTSP
ncbi:hypothetical protein PI125_g22833 [Phytophthora idaei]|nr:hypothetical protein PI125_g22833 [Phytophthora idaei]